MRQESSLSDDPIHELSPRNATPVVRGYVSPRFADPPLSWTRPTRAFRFKSMWLGSEKRSSCRRRLPDGKCFPTPTKLKVLHGTSSAHLRVWPSGRSAATAGFFVRRGADNQIRLEDFAKALHVFEQRQHHGEAGFSVDGAAPVNAPVFEPAVEWVANHRLDADGVDVDVDRDPTVGLPAPDAAGVRAARIDVFTLDSAAKRLKPGRCLRSDLAFVDRAGARPGSGLAGCRDDLGSDGEATFGGKKDSPYYMEAELNSPMCRLKPGEECAFDTDWFPTRAESDIREMADAGILVRPLRATPSDNGKVKLSGTFGVFYAGHLIANFYNEHGSKIGALQAADVTPAELVNLNTELAPDGKAARVSLHLVDEAGVDRGALQEVRISAADSN